MTGKFSRHTNSVQSQKELVDQLFSFLPLTFLSLREEKRVEAKYVHSAGSAVV